MSGISSSLSVLFNGSFDECCVPIVWKTTLVIPIHIGSSKSTLSNHRPIALLSIISKVVDKIFYRRLMTVLGPVPTPSQSGFKKGDGTHKQLIRLVQEWPSALDSGSPVGVVYLDISKAF